MFVTTAGQKRIHTLSDYGVDIREANADSVAGWWRAGGVTATVLAAYAPKGAASYVASKTNLDNPGTNDATDGAAFPAWNTATGWTATAALSQYLIGPSITGANKSIIVKFSGAAASFGSQFIFGVTVGAFPNSLYLQPNRTGSAGVLYFNGSSVFVAPLASSGIFCIAGTKGYRNGVEETAALAGTIAGVARPCGIFCQNSLGIYSNFISATITSIALYDVSLLTLAQIIAIGAAMP